MELQAIHIIERDVNNDIFVTWTFPSATKALKQVICDRCGLDNERDLVSQSGFSKFKNVWLYHMTVAVSNPQQANVKGVSVCVCASKFNPTKYHDLLAPLLKVYQSTFDPVAVLQPYLSVVSSGKMSTPSGLFDQSKYDDRRAYVVPLKPIFELFGVESIIIWMAMLLKKRIFVYSSRVSDLLQHIRSFPLLGAWHRMDWSILRPMMNLKQLEIADLRATGVYVAGFTDSSCASNEELYDVFVDLSNRSVSIAEHAKSAFALTKFHTDLAKKFARCAESENDQGVIKFVAVKTKELVENLKTLRTDDGHVTLEDLQNRQLPMGMAPFLFNVALAEKLTK